MNLQNLYEELDMQSPEDFQYFEQLEFLMECDEEPEYDDFYQVLSQADPACIGELLEYYMDDLSGALPGNGEDLYTIFENVKQQLLILCTEMDQNEEVRTDFIQKLYDFRQWLNEPGKAKAGSEKCSVLMAITQAREDKLSGVEQAYDFSAAADYKMDEIAMPLGAFSSIEM